MGERLYLPAPAEYIAQSNSQVITAGVRAVPKWLDRDSHSLNQHICGELGRPRFIHGYMWRRTWNPSDLHRHDGIYQRRK